MKNSESRPLRRRTDAIILVILAALVVILFHEALFGGKVFFFRDFSFFFYPKRHLVAERLREFDVPFWNSNAGCGEGVLGTYQVAAFYPPALIYYLLPLPWSFMWFVVLHFFIAGSGTYYMMRAFGARRAASAFAAIAWAFSPALVSTVDNVSFMNSLAWLPWCLFSARRLSLARRGGNFAGLTLSLAMAILAGGPEPVAFILAILIAYALVRCLAPASRPKGATSPGGFFQRRSWRVGALVLAAVAVAVLISGVEVAPLVHALRWSGRSEQSITSAGHWAAAPSDALLWLLPRFYLSPDRGGIYFRSQQWLKTVYMGVAVPCLALWTILFVRRRRNLFFIVLAAVASALAVGNASPLWRLLWHWLPGFSLVRFPVKWFMPAAFAFGVLSGFALDDFLVCARRKERLRPALLAGTMLAAAALFGAFYLATRLWTAQTFQAMTPPQLAQEMTAGNQAAVDEASERFISAQWSLGRSSLFLFAGGAALVAAAAFARIRIPRPYGAAAVAAVFFADVALFDAELNPTARAGLYTNPPAHLASAPHGEGAGRLYATPAMFTYARSARLARFNDAAGLAEYLGSVRGTSACGPDETLQWTRDVAGMDFGSVDELDRWIVLSEGPRLRTVAEQEYLKEVFHPNLNLLYGVAATDSFEPLLPRWHFDLLNRLRQGAVDAERARYLPVLWGATTVVERTEAAPGFTYLPIRPQGKRALVVDHVVAVADEAEARSTLLETDIDVLKRVILEGDDADEAAAFLGEGALAAPGDDWRAPGDARVVWDSGDELVMEVTAERPALLFAADNWYPNFSATVDGNAAPIWRANYAYRAVPVPEGPHTVRFTYVPTEFHAGLAMSALGLAALALACRKL